MIVIKTIFRIMSGLLELLLFVLFASDEAVDDTNDNLDDACTVESYISINAGYSDWDD